MVSCIGLGVLVGALVGVGNDVVVGAAVGERVAVPQPAKTQTKTIDKIFISLWFILSTP